MNKFVMQNVCLDAHTLFAENCFCYLGNAIFCYSVEEKGLKQAGGNRKSESVSGVSGLHIFSRLPAIPVNFIPHTISNPSIECQTFHDTIHANLTTLPQLI